MAFLRIAQNRHQWQYVSAFEGVTGSFLGRARNVLVAFFLGSYAILVMRPSLAHRGPKYQGDTAEYRGSLNCYMYYPRHCVTDRNAGLRATPSVLRVDILQKEDTLSFRHQFSPS